LNSLADIAASTFGTIADSFGRSVSYSRGTVSKTLTVIPSKSDIQAADGPDGFLGLPERQTDWLISTDALAPEFAEPQEGDRLDLIMGHLKQTWEILRPANLSAAWEWSDHAQQWARIHTKLVKLEVTTPAASAVTLAAETV